MRYWAELDETNTVVQVTVGDSKTEDGGLVWLEENLGGVWVETWLDGDVRKHYAGIGYTYDEGLDAFIPPQPFPSWVLDEETFSWVAPVTKPSGDHVWDEQAGQWVKA